MKAVRALYPDAKITLLVRPWVAGLFEAAAFLDSVWSRPEPRGLSGWAQIAKEIRQRDFDLVVLLPNSFAAALTAWIGGIPQRMGYATDGRGLLLTRSMRPSARKQHQSRYYLELVEGLLGPVPEPTITIETTEIARTAARRLLEKEGVDPAGGFVVVTPGAAFGSAKRWYEARFARVADRLADKLGLAIVIVGSESERLIGEKVRDEMRNPATVLSGKTTLETLVGLLTQASLMITNDSGPMHIAAALGIPTVAVFGSTDAEATYPLGSSSASGSTSGPVQSVPVARMPDRPPMHGSGDRGRCFRNCNVAGDKYRRAWNHMKEKASNARCAVFLDRDGTVSEEVGYMYDVSLYKIFPWTGDAIRRLNESGMKVALATNQSGIERGYFRKEMVRRVHDHLRNEIARSQATLDAAYFCPHHPKSGCPCRKPRPGMLLQGREELRCQPGVFLHGGRQVRGHSVRQGCRRHDGSGPDR